MSGNYFIYASVAVSVLIIYSIASTVRQYLRLRHIKGPPGAGFSKWWLIRAIRSGRSHLEFYEACEKYGTFNTSSQQRWHLLNRIVAGSIARVGPNDLTTNDPDLMKHMLNVRTNYKRSYWYDGMRLKPGKDNVLSARDDELHNRLRSKMAAGVSRYPKE